MSLMRFRVSVPKEDESALAFLAAQVNVSASVRELIHAYVRDYGATDVLAGLSGTGPVKGVVQGSQRPTQARAMRALGEQAQALAPKPAPRPRKASAKAAEAPAADADDSLERINSMMGN